MSSLSDRIAALSPEKRALLERRLQAKHPATAPDRPGVVEASPSGHDQHQQRRPALA